MKRDFVSEKECRSKSKDESAYLYANGCKGRGDIRKPQTTAHKPFGMQRKEKREFMSDSKEQQVMMFVKKSVYLCIIFKT